jgi:hypothetical protein
VIGVGRTRGPNSVKRASLRAGTPQMAGGYDFDLEIRSTILPLATSDKILATGRIPYCAEQSFS